MTKPSMTESVWNGPPDDDYHSHPNGGGLVSRSAHVELTVYVGPLAVVAGRADVTGRVKLLDAARIEDDATVGGEVQLRHHARISGSAVVTGRVILVHHAHITDDAKVEGGILLEYFAHIGEQNHLMGVFRVEG